MMMNYWFLKLLLVVGTLVAAEAFVIPVPVSIVGSNRVVVNNILIQQRPCGYSYTALEATRKRKKRRRKKPLPGAAAGGVDPAVTPKAAAPPPMPQPDPIKVSQEKIEGLDDDDAGEEGEDVVEPNVLIKEEKAVDDTKTLDLQIGGGGQEQMKMDVGDDVEITKDDIKQMKDIANFSRGSTTGSAIGIQPDPAITRGTKRKRTRRRRRGRRHTQLRPSHIFIWIE